MIFGGGELGVFILGFCQEGGCRVGHEELAYAPGVVSSQKKIVFTHTSRSKDYTKDEKEEKEEESEKKRKITLILKKTPGNQFHLTHHGRSSEIVHRRKQSWGILPWDWYQSSWLGIRACQSFRHPPYCWILS